MNKLNILTLGASLLAIAVIVITPIYTDNQHAKAVERQMKWNSIAPKNKLKPSELGCADDHVRVTYYGGSIPVSIPVWSDSGIVKCGKAGYTVNEKTISKHEAEKLAQSNIDDHVESENERTNGGNSSGPVFDPSFIISTINDALAGSGLSDSERKELELMKSEYYRLGKL